MEPDPIRFYLDENLPPEIASQLARHGIDVIRGPLREADISHLKRASALGRVLCTRDRDFLQLQAMVEEHAGIIEGLKHHGIGDKARRQKWCCGQALILRSESAIIAAQRARCMCMGGRCNGGEAR